MTKEWEVRVQQYEEFGGDGDGRVLELIRRWKRPQDGGIDLRLHLIRKLLFFISTLLFQ